MDCLSALLLTCLTQNVYITTEIQSQMQKPTYEGRWCATRWCTGPLGVVRLGTQLNLTTGLTIDLGVVHTSYIATTKDRGEESAYLSLTYRPFAK